MFKYSICALLYRSCSNFAVIFYVIACISLKVWWYVLHNARVWWTDSQVDRHTLWNRIAIICTILCMALHSNTTITANNNVLTDGQLILWFLLHNADSAVCNAVMPRCLSVTLRCSGHTGWVASKVTQISTVFSVSAPNISNIMPGKFGKDHNIVMKIAIICVLMSCQLFIISM